MGPGNCGFGMSMGKEPLMGGDGGTRNFGCEIVRDGSAAADDEGLEVYEEWLLICKDVQKVWEAGWALEPDGPFVATQNKRPEAIDACTLLKSVAPIDLGAQELVLASERPQKLANEFCGRDSERQAQRRVVEGKRARKDEKKESKKEKNDEKKREKEQNKEAKMEKKDDKKAAKKEKKEEEKEAKEERKEEKKEDHEEKKKVKTGTAKVGLVRGLEGSEGWRELLGDMKMVEAMVDLNGDGMKERCASYAAHCNAGNKCFLLRGEKMAILILLKYGRRLDP